LLFIKVVLNFLTEIELVTLLKLPARLIIFFALKLILLSMLEICIDSKHFINSMHFINHIQKKIFSIIFLISFLSKLQFPSFS
jgi:hypothetical protein